MDKLKIGLVLVFAIVFSFCAKAQNTMNLRINEVLVDNQTNMVDEYGERVAWIEIYNKSFATVNMEGCFLTNDKNNPTKFRIPKGNINTKIAPRQYAIFWAENMPNRGAFYLNFGLDKEKDNYIALYDTDGKTLIDEVTIPVAAIQTDLSYGRKIDGSPEWEIKGENDATYITPKANNQQNIENTKIAEFREQDSIGVGMAIIAMSVVFIALILLYLSFKLMGIISIKMANKKEMKANNNNIAASASKATSVGKEDEIAAVVMALHEHFGVHHDVENMVLTFNEIGTTSSPWSTKFFGMRQK